MRKEHGLGEPFDCVYNNYAQAGCIVSTELNFCQIASPGSECPKQKKNKT